jgi:hypothetical protein
MIVVQLFDLDHFFTGIWTGMLNLQFYSFAHDLAHHAGEKTMRNSADSPILWNTMAEANLADRAFSEDEMSDLGAVLLDNET